MCNSTEILMKPLPPDVYSFEELAFPTLGVEFEFNSQIFTRPYIAFNMVASIDGKTTTSKGDMTGLGSRMDRQVMNRLRSQVDAVVVGGETFRNDPFIPTIKPDLMEERQKNFTKAQPLGIVVTNSGNLPLDHQFWQAGKDLRLIFLGAAASLEAEKSLSAKAEVVRMSSEISSDRINLAEMLDMLWRKFGVKTLMVEGGASLNYEFVSTGWSDELFLTICPKLVGGTLNSTILSGENYGLANLVDLSCRSLYHHQNELYLRYQIESRSVTKLGDGVA
jgi:2,5-diamino-6-(ribosylamino)-4(3H)-pyrimidinone 5'-phosphate reductase